MSDLVKEYYGKILQRSQDLKTNACTSCVKFAPYINEVVNLIHKDVMQRFYGCGLVIPQLLQGTKVLDLGCGAGRDCYILSKIVGKEGSVVGVDMTKEQIQFAERFKEYHKNAFGFANVEFQEGYIERLGLADNTFDVLVSNCVINLSPDKLSVFQEAFRVLKEGGEFYFSDVYSDRRIPQSLVEDPLLYGECLSGALYWNDFLRMVKKAGFLDPRLVESVPITINNPPLEKALGNIRFYSATYRLFKLSSLESACEDYGQAVIYRGTIENNPHFFKLDSHHKFLAGKITPVCGNTFDMLHDTRFSPHFEYLGTKTTHYGIFEGCGINLPFNESNLAKASCC